MISTDNSTALDSFPLVLEYQYLQLTPAPALGTNIYGLREVVASSGFRRDVGADGGVGTIQTMWAQDIPDTIEQKVWVPFLVCQDYGSHPIYLEHRYNATTKRSQTHGVFLFSSAGSDDILLTALSSNLSVVEYRLICGTLNLYSLSSPSP
ncbi:uncharacterized protein PHACADRAFT_203524 [Phanerochaete carnosa HHB-10118-sp]|uniref:Uncharacterized protein n=1 Tax=Phanerochaete carnosa (strain HHB-10118-sp) TaxID=650164 RepID=K5VBM1_PHACS|nr:uncharacterized protein PHACADRAFT_203524 [Phanerochaete carnosa HHB-10118-sp]EKM60286.1 hypothetical protein PHACADRAFT_203524 [Phanerochaete carnosa HHB-10118-sp]